MSPEKPLEETHEMVWIVRHLNPERAKDDPLEFRMEPQSGHGAVVSFVLADPGFPRLPEFRKVTVEAEEGGRGLLSADLARLNLDKLLEMAYKSAGGPDGMAHYAQALRGGRPTKIDKAFLREVWEVAQAAPDRPRMAVAERFRVSPRQASYYVKRANEEFGEAK